MSADTREKDERRWSAAQKLEPGDIAVEIVLRGPLAKKLRAEARKRRRRPVDLFADLVESVLEDDLVAAVLDE